MRQCRRSRWGTCHAWWCCISHRCWTVRIYFLKVSSRVGAHFHNHNVCNQPSLAAHIAHCLWCHAENMCCYNVLASCNMGTHSSVFSSGMQVFNWLAAARTSTRYPSSSLSMPSKRHRVACDQLAAERGWRWRKAVNLYWMYASDLLMTTRP